MSRTSTSTSTSMYCPRRVYRDPFVPTTPCTLGCTSKGDTHPSPSTPHSRPSPSTSCCASRLITSIPRPRIVATMDASGVGDVRPSTADGSPFPSYNFATVTKGGARGERLNLGVHRLRKSAAGRGRRVITIPNPSIQPARFAPPKVVAYIHPAGPFRPTESRRLHPSSRPVSPHRVHLR